MRVLLIDEKAVKELHQRLELACFKECRPGHNTAAIAERYKISEEDLKRMMEDMHSRFNYHLRSWFSEQGA